MKIINRYLSTYSFKEIVTSIISTSQNPTGDFYQGKLHLYFSSASSALKYYLEQNKIQGKIIIPAYTCEKVISAVKQAGCEPLYLDIELKSGTLQSTSLSEIEVKGVVAVIATHIFGMQCDLENIYSWCKNRDILVIEDRALISPFLYDKELSNADIHIGSFGKGKFLNMGFGGVLIEGKQTLNIKPNIDFHKLDLSRTITKLILNSNEFNKMYMNFEFLIKKYLLKRKKHSLTQLSEVENYILPEIFGRVMISLAQSKAYKIRAQHCKALSEIYMMNIVQGENVRIPKGIAVEKHVSSFFPVLCSGQDELLEYFRKRNIDLGCFFNYCAGHVFGNELYENGTYFSSRIILLPLHMNVSESDALKISKTMDEWSRCKK